MNGGEELKEKGLKFWMKKDGEDEKQYIYIYIYIYI